MTVQHQIQRNIFVHIQQPEPVEETPESEEIVHEDNEWGISLVDDDQPVENVQESKATGNLNLVEGVTVGQKINCILLAKLKKFYLNLGGL